MERPLDALVVVIYTVSLAVVPAFTQSQPSRAQQPASAQQASGLANASGNSRLESGRAGEMISLKDGRLTLKVVNRGIDSVIGLITRTTRVPIVDTEGVLDGHRVSFDFQNMPLDEALRLILKDYDTFFLYAGDGAAPAIVRQVWIYAKGEGRGFDPIPREACASTKELRDMAHDGDPKLKARALPALIEREGSKAQDLVMQWLNSADEEERNLALYYAMENNLELPTEILMNLAVADNSPAIRVMALDALAGADLKTAEQVFQQALDDPDVHVRAKAKEIVEQLNPPAGAASTNQTH